MPFIKNFKGKTAPAVALLFKSGRVHDARGGNGNYNRKFWVHNQRVTKFTITGIAAGRIITWKREATDANPYFSQSLNTYTLPPVAAEEINTLIDNPNTQWKIDLEFSFETFFDWLLYHMVYCDQTKLDNFAHPPDPQKILDTLIYQPPTNNDVVKVDYRTSVVQCDNIPMKLKDAACQQVPVPAVKLTFEMVLVQNEVDENSRIARWLTAMDWTELKRAGHGTKEVEEFEALAERAEDWYYNVMFYLVNQTSFDRGESIRKQIVANCVPAAVVQPNGDQILVAKVREQIDTWLIASNHWDQPRENWQTEPYQKICSDVFGTILQTAEVAAPLKILREIIQSLGYANLSDANLLEQARLILQYGFGNCGEHAKATLTILDDLKNYTGTVVQHIVLASLANIDHEFTIMNLDVTDIIPTNTHGDNPYLTNNHETEIQVFDLQQAETANTAAHRTGYVIDAYLDPTVQPAVLTTASFLQSLHSAPRIQRHKDTDYLRFHKKIPGTVTVGTKVDTLTNI